MIPGGQYSHHGFIAFLFREDRTRRPNISRPREAFLSLAIQSRWYMYTAPRRRHATHGSSLVRAGDCESWFCFGLGMLYFPNLGDLEKERSPGVRRLTASCDCYDCAPFLITRLPYFLSSSSAMYAGFFLTMTTPSSIEVTGTYSSVANSARSPDASSTGLVCWAIPVIVLGLPA